jgi:hypothetical protein
MKTSNQNTTSDLRFIVVTDLGLIVKKSLDGSQDVFVQSISNGDACGRRNRRMCSARMVCKYKPAQPMPMAA